MPASVAAYHAPALNSSHTLKGICNYKTILGCRFFTIKLGPKIVADFWDEQGALAMRISGPSIRVLSFLPPLGNQSAGEPSIRSLRDVRIHFNIMLPKPKQ